MSDIDRFIDGVERVYTETELSTHIPTILQDVMMLPIDHDRSKYISDHKWRRMSLIMQKAYDMDIAQLRMIRPMMIMGQLYERVVDADGVKLDQYIWQTALEMGKPTHGLESIHEQASILRSIQLSYDYDMLYKWCRNISRANSEMQELLNVYHRQDIHELHRRSAKSLGAIRHLMLRDRNVRMADRIANLASDMPSFFTFGAGHLGGYHGVIRLLKNKGLKVSPIEKIV